jgi:hypothetical protein
MTLSIAMLCYNAECHYAEWHILFTIMLNVVILCVVMLNVILLSVIMLTVIMLSVVAPFILLNIQDSSYLKCFSNVHFLKRENLIKILRENHYYKVL